MKDDPELLDLMMNDNKKAPKLYQATNYWFRYEKILIPELKTLGLHNFRRRHNSLLSSFGACDYLPSSEFTNIQYVKREGFSRKLVHFFLRNLLKNKKFEKLINYVASGYVGISQNDLNLLSYEFANYYGRMNKAKPIENFEGSQVGNPENAFWIDGKLYTTALLNYYVKYSYCCQFLNFNSINTITEIGSGGAKQIEVIKKLHPHITFYLFDIPPPLYVTEQYLQSLFPGSVISYRETRNTEQISTTEPGKIFIFGPEKISELKDLSYDFFFNTHSFQEMEPKIVLNYLNFVNSQTKKYVFLAEATKGKELAKKAGEHGVLQKTTFEHYKNGLKDFHMVDTIPRIRLPKLKRITSGAFMFWERNSS